LIAGADRDVIVMRLSVVQKRYALVVCLPGGKMDSEKIPQPLQQSSFPRACESCQKVYQNEREFFRDTAPVANDDDNAGARIQANSDNGGYLEISRHCPCGAIVKERFHSRRDLSEEGLRDRATFEDLLKAVEESGVERAQARTMLLDFLAGEPE
jgi:hypothetical protein